MQKYLIVGLGNIGDKYLNTRHNIGFLVLDKIAIELEEGFKKNNFGTVAKAKYKSRPVFLLKPDTYMNLSGLSVKYWLKKENIPLENLIIITDDLNIPFGSVRIRGKGSSGGHNGLKSLEQELGTSKYIRIRVGIGKDFAPGEQIDFVLENWNETEKEKLVAIINKCKDAALSLTFHGLTNTMNNFNGLV